MSSLMRLGFFLLVSAGLHGLLYLEVGSRMKGNDTTRVRTTLVPLWKAPEKTPAKITRPVKKPTPLPKLTRAAEKTGVDRGRKTPPPEAKTNPPSPQKPARKVRKKPTPRTREEFLRHVARCADRAPAEGRAVPDLVTDDHLSYQDVRDIVGFFGFKVVAYPLPRDGKPTFYLELTGPDLETVTRREGRAALEGYSNRARDLTGHPTFWTLLTRVAAHHGLDPYHARIAAVVPENIDRFFLYQQHRAAQQAGLTLESIRSTQGRFQKTDVGWKLEIYEVTPLSGPAVRTAMR